MASRRFGSNTYAIKPILTTAQLRYPIVLLKAKQRPQAGTESWHTSVKPYAEPWADFDEGITRPSRGDEADNQVLHLFRIRNDPTLNIECGDFVVHEDVLYTIVGLKRKRGRMEVLEIRTNIYSTVANADLIQDDTIPTPPKSGNGNNPFFTG